MRTTWLVLRAEGRGWRVLVRAPRGVAHAMVLDAVRQLNLTHTRVVPLTIARRYTDDVPEATDPPLPGDLTRRGYPAWRVAQDVAKERLIAALVRAVVSRGCCEAT